MTEDKRQTETTETARHPVLYRVQTWTTGDRYRYYFASVDGGQTWIGVNRMPRQTDRNAIRSILDGWTDPSGCRHGLITVNRSYFAAVPAGRTTWTVTDATVAPS